MAEDKVTKLHVINLPNFTEKRWIHKINNVSWTLHLITEKNSLSLKLICNEKNASPIWKCTASICLSFLKFSTDVLAGVEDFLKLDGFEFNAAANFVEVQEFKTLDELFREENGYLDRQEELTIILEVSDQKTSGILQKPAGFDFCHPNQAIFDETIWVEGKKVFVGKQILSTHSELFKRAFSIQNAKVVIEDLKQQDFLNFLKFLYPTGKKLREDNVLKILEMAIRFEAHELAWSCEKFLKEDRKMTKIQKFKIAENFGLSELQNHLLNSLRTSSEIQALTTEPAYSKLSDSSKLAILNRLLKKIEEAVNPDSNTSSSSLTSSTSTTTFEEIGSVVIQENEMLIASDSECLDYESDDEDSEEASGDVEIIENTLDLFRSRNSHTEVIDL